MDQLLNRLQMGRPLLLQRADDLPQPNFAAATASGQSIACMSALPPVPPPQPMLIDSPESAVWYGVGFPVALAGAGPQPAGSKKARQCAGCPSRLNRVKGKLHKRAGLQICQRCYDTDRGKVAAPAAAIPAPLPPPAATQPAAPSPSLLPPPRKPRSAISTRRGAIGSINLHSHLTHTRGCRLTCSSC